MMRRYGASISLCDQEERQDGQKQMGDITGLARTTAALADLYISVDQLGEATTLLAESLALNFEKGSPIGLAFKRRTLQTLQMVLGQARGEPAEALPLLLAEVERRLVQAEAVLGQLTLPVAGLLTQEWLKFTANMTVETAWPNAAGQPVAMTEASAGSWVSVGVNPVKVDDIISGG